MNIVVKNGKHCEKRIAINVRETDNSNELKKKSLKRKSRLLDTNCASMLKNSILSTPNYRNRSSLVKHFVDDKKENINLISKTQNIARNLPYDNGIGKPKTIGTLEPCRYQNKSDLFKDLMEMISSRLVNSVPPSLRKDPKKESLKRIRNALLQCTNEHDLIKYENKKKESVENVGKIKLELKEAGRTTNTEYIPENTLNTFLLHDSKRIMTEFSRMSSNDVHDGSPEYKYYPHRLN